MSATILYFAHMRELTGSARETFDLPSHLHSITDLAHWLAAKSAGHAAAFADLSRVRVAVNQVMADFDHPLDGAHEIAFFPPVTGG